jgi:hypothetical protein
MADEEEMALAALALAKVKERFGPEGGSAPAQSGDKFCFVEYGEEALAPDEEEREAKREAAISAAKRENLTLVVAENSGGYFGVKTALGPRSRHPRPYQARVTHSGKSVYLGSFATAEEAALCVARTLEVQGRGARSPPSAALTSDEALQQAQTEKLTLLEAATTGGYFGVSHHKGRSRPYQAMVSRGGKSVPLGRFATAEEAALCVARTPEGQKTATRRAKKDGGAKRPRH